MAKCKDHKYKATSIDLLECSICGFNEVDGLMDRSDELERLKMAILALYGEFSLKELERKAKEVKI